MKIKSLVLLVLATLSLASCKKDDKDKGKLDPNAKITATGVHSLTKTDTNPVEIEGTGITDSLEYITKYAHGFSNHEQIYYSFGVEHLYYYLRDIENNKLKFRGSMVIGNGGELGEIVTKDLNIIIAVNRVRNNPTGSVLYPLDKASSLLHVVPDTVGYIPNSVVLEARAKITTAFEAEDYATCYKLFDEASLPLAPNGAHSEIEA